MRTKTKSSPERLLVEKVECKKKICVPFVGIYYSMILKSPLSTACLTESTNYKQFQQLFLSEIYIKVLKNTTNTLQMVVASNKFICLFLLSRKADFFDIFSSVMSFSKAYTEI